MPTSYEILTHDRAGRKHTRPYTSEDALAAGSVLELGGRYWLVTRVDGGRAEAAPARYRMTLEDPDGRAEHGPFRRYRADAPRTGHQFTIYEHGVPSTWSVEYEHLARERAGQPFLELVAERYRAEGESLPDHQLEHALDRSDHSGGSPSAKLDRATVAGTSAELVALEACQAPDWDEAARFLDALGLEEIGDDLLELCGVDTRRQPEAAWVGIVQQRLRDDLARFRDDIEGDHDEIEEWDFRGGRIFAAIGSPDDEASPARGYGWLCRLVDSDTLGAAGFRRVRKASLVP